MPVRGINAGTGVEIVRQILRTEAGRAIISKHAGQQYATGKALGEKVLGHVLGSLPEGKEADFINGIRNAKTAEEARLYA